MSEVSLAYTETEKIHDAFFEPSGLLTDVEIIMSGVGTCIGSTSSRTSKRIETVGYVDGRWAKQTLAKDINGNFRLSTTFLEYGGEHVQADIRPESPNESLDIVEGMLFAQAMRYFLAARQI